MGDLVQFTKSGNIAVITINNPPVNALFLLRFNNLWCQYWHPEERRDERRLYAVAQNKL